MSSASHHRESYIFTIRVGVNINLCDGGVSARRKSPSQSLVFSAHCLEAGELFEVKITELDPVYSGGLGIGLTTYNTGGEGGRVRAELGPGLGEVWWCSGSNILRNGQVTCNNSNKHCLE